GPRGLTRHWRRPRNPPLTPRQRVRLKSTPTQRTARWVAGFRSGARAPTSEPFAADDGLDGRLEPNASSPRVTRKMVWMGCSRPVESSVLRKGRSTWRGATRRWALAALVATDVLVVSSAWAASTDRARERATQAVSEVEAAASRLSTQARPAHRHDPTKMV